MYLTLFNIGKFSIPQQSYAPLKSPQVDPSSSTEGYYKPYHNLQYLRSTSECQPDYAYMGVCVWLCVGVGVGVRVIEKDLGRREGGRGCKGQFKNCSKLWLDLFRLVSIKSISCLQQWHKVKTQLNFYSKCKQFSCHLQAQQTTWYKLW